MWPYKYFTVEEMRCKCGCGMLPTPEFMLRLEALRELYGKPIIVTSGARCIAYNRKIKGSSGSKHTLGIAVDISCNSAEKFQLVKLAIKLGEFGGIGVAKTFLHLDTRPLSDAVIWTY